jgi:2-polyprenyl-3-methyl-5-hydroxy-6-metoxy-1,4-benzoquinol methylase
MSRDYSDYWSSLKGSHGSHPGNLFRYELIAGELRRARLQPATVIDCGCGDGSLLSVISAAIECGELYGFDIAASVPPGLREAIHFQQQDLGAPVPALMQGQFDLVLCSEVIEHVQDDDTVLANLFALARPGGMVVLTTQTGTIYKTEQFLGHLRHYPFEQLQRRVEETGLKVVRAFRSGWPWLNMQKIAAHILQDTVQTKIVQAEHLSIGVRMLFATLRRIYRFSSRSHGPQLFILARKPLAKEGS